MSTPWFIKKVNPKLMLVQLMLRNTQNDKKNADMLFDSLSSAEESWKGLECTEEEVEEITLTQLTRALEVSSENAEKDPALRSVFGMDVNIKE